METRADRRKRKLQELADEKGLAVIAQDAGLSAVALEQILKGVLLPSKSDGTRSPRSLGDAAARKIEAVYDLGAGWFDGQELSADAIELAMALDAIEDEDIKRSAHAVALQVLRLAVRR